MPLCCMLFIQCWLSLLQADLKYSTPEIPNLSLMGAWHLWKLGLICSNTALGPGGSNLLMMQDPGPDLCKTHL